MRFLVTRPVEDAGRTADRLRALGAEALVEPLLTIQFRQNIPLSRERLQALLVTSANGLRALMVRPDAQSWAEVPLFAVGPTTGGLARAMGFRHVREAGGDVISLNALVRAHCRVDQGRLVHLSGLVSAGDLAGDLRAAGFEVEKAVLYEAVATTQMTAATCESLRAAKVDGVLLYSPRTAEIFSRLLVAAGLAEICSSLEAFCLSANAAAPLRSLGFKELHIAAQPSEDALFALIEPQFIPKSRP